MIRQYYIMIYNLKLDTYTTSCLQILLVPQLKSIQTSKNKYVLKNISKGMIKYSYRSNLRGLPFTYKKV